MLILFKYEIKLYVTGTGNQPFSIWLESLDPQIRYRIYERLDRIRFGNLGDYKLLNKGIYELRLSFGAGYRIYYGREGKQMIILLNGGYKSSQKRDIRKASLYWQDYLLR